MNYVQPQLLNWSHGDESNSSIGHSMYNYISVLLFSKIAGLGFIHTDVEGYGKRFNNILNLKNKFQSINDINISETVIINQFDFRNNLHIEDCLNLIKKYNNKNNVLFKLDFNNGNLFPGKLIQDSEWLMEIFSKSYFDSNKKVSIYEPYFNNIAVHIRRNDITKNKNPDRWEDNEFYIKIINKLNKEKDSKFFIISDGVLEDFTSITKKYKNLNIIKLSTSYASDESLFNQTFDSKYNLILGGKDTEIFHMLAQSDILVTGQSSFSTLCTYINKGKIIYTECKEFTDFGKFKDQRFINVINL
jgi:hypothetical protein